MVEAGRQTGGNRGYRHPPPRQVGKGGEEGGNCRAGATVRVGGASSGRCRPRARAVATSFCGRMYREEVAASLPCGLASAAVANASAEWRAVSA